MNINVIQKHLPLWKCETPSPHSGIYYCKRDFLNRTGRKNLMVLLDASIDGKCYAYIFVHPEKGDFMNLSEYELYIEKNDEESLEDYIEDLGKLWGGVVFTELARQLFGEDELDEIKKDMLAIRPFIS